MTCTPSFISDYRGTKSILVQAKVLRITQGKPRLLHTPFSSSRYRTEGYGVGAFRESTSVRASSKQSVSAPVPTVIRR